METQNEPRVGGNLKTLRRNAEAKGHIIKLEHVKSHIGIKNNDRADKNATLGAAGCDKMSPTIKNKSSGPGWKEIEIHEKTT
mgnify:CR=1 FL=1